jgi:tetratricopeptide (TPR) repeat protein
MTRIFVTLAVVLASVVFGTTQTSPAPQAKTPQEFDLYLDFHEARDPETRHQIALRFERTYPHSELLVDVYGSELEYSRARGQREAAITAGERGLRLAPNNIEALLGLAEILPNGASDSRTFSSAEGYARNAFAQLKSMRFSHEVSMGDCESARRVMVSRAHAALGYVFGKRGQLADAIKELEMAIATSPEPVGWQLLFTGELYRAAKREQDAIDMFNRAAQAGPAEITLLAHNELKANR